MKLSLTLLMFVMACGYVSSNSGHVYCGRRLSNVLAALCWGPDDNMVKRAAWWMPHGSARALGSARGKRGLVDECCDKPCTIDELMTYC